LHLRWEVLHMRKEFGHLRPAFARCHFGEHPGSAEGRPRSDAPTIRTVGAPNAPVIHSRIVIPLKLNINYR
jgi:hypothetical protein